MGLLSREFPPSKVDPVHGLFHNDSENRVCDNVQGQKTEHGGLRHAVRLGVDICPLGWNHIRHGAASVEFPKAHLLREEDVIRAREEEGQEIRPRRRRLWVVLEAKYLRSYGQEQEAPDDVNGRHARLCEKSRGEDSRAVDSQPQEHLPSNEDSGAGRREQDVPVQYAEDYEAREAGKVKDDEPTDDPGRRGAAPAHGVDELRHARLPIGRDEAGEAVYDEKVAGKESKDVDLPDEHDIVFLLQSPSVRLGLPRIHEDFRGCRLVGYGIVDGQLEGQV